MGKDECSGSPHLLRAGDKALAQTFTHSETEKESELHSSAKLPRLLCRTWERFWVCFCILMSLALCITDSTCNNKLKRIVSGAFNVVFCQNHCLKNFVLTETNFFLFSHTPKHLGNAITGLIWCFSARVVSPQIMRFWCSYIAAFLELIYCVIIWRSLCGSLLLSYFSVFLMSFSCFHSEKKKKKKNAPFPLNV